jgi:hypothetical protein
MKAQIYHYSAAIFNSILKEWNVVLLDHDKTDWYRMSASGNLISEMVPSKYCFCPEVRMLFLPSLHSPESDFR